MNKQKLLARTLDPYATEVGLPVLHSFSRKYLHRTDHISDIYKFDSLKASARTKRGRGIWEKKVVGMSQVSSSLNNFLRPEDNKIELFKFLATHAENTDTLSTVIIKECVCSVIEC